MTGSRVRVTQAAPFTRLRRAPAATGFSGSQAGNAETLTLQEPASEITTEYSHTLHTRRWVGAERQQPHMIGMARARLGARRNAMQKAVLPLTITLTFLSPAYAQTTNGPSNMVPDATRSNPPIIRTPPSVRTGSGVPGSDLPSINPSRPAPLRDYSNPVFRSGPLNGNSNIRRR